MNEEFIMPLGVTPMPLNSRKEICKILDIGRNKFEKLVARGAPIVKEGKGLKTTYSAEYNQLQAWRVANPEY